MKHLRLAVTSLLALLVLTDFVAAQKRPDFTGTWVEDAAQRKVSPPDPAVANVKGALAMQDPPEVITQTAERITVAQTFMGQTNRITYELDGRENKNRRGAQILTTRTRWDGNRLVTEGTIHQVTSAGEESWKLREVRSMSAKGEMVLDVTHVDEDRKSRTVTQVLKKRP